MNEVQRCVGINVTASRLQFVEVEKELNQLLISNIGQTFISPPLNFEDQVEANIQNQLQTAFDEIKIRNPVTSSFASFTLPPELFINVQLPYDANLNPNEIREEFNWEISQLFPYISIDELAIKFYELDKGLLPGKCNALVVALSKKHLLLIKYFCIKNNLTPKLVDNASITANSFLNSSAITGKDSVTVNIFNSRHSITLFINISSKPVYVKVFQKHEDRIISRIIDDLSKEPRAAGVTELDITRQQLPACDLIVCRYVLNHLDRERVRAALDLFRLSGFYLLATQHSGHLDDTNADYVEYDLRDGLGEPLESHPDTRGELALWTL